jgi:hypothetical protein
VNKIAVDVMVDAVHREQNLFPCWVPASDWLALHHSAVLIALRHFATVLGTALPRATKYVF